MITLSMVDALEGLRDWLCAIACGPQCSLQRVTCREDALVRFTWPSQPAGNPEAASSSAAQNVSASSATLVTFKAIAKLAEYPQSQAMPASVLLCALSQIKLFPSVMTGLHLQHILDARALQTQKHLCSICRLTLQQLLQDLLPPRGQCRSLHPVQLLQNLPA